MFRLQHRIQFFKFTLKQYEQLKKLKQYREILNASSQSTYEELRLNFFQLIKEYHPDRSLFNAQINTNEREEITKIITEAYTILTNEYVKQESDNIKKNHHQYEPERQQDKIYYNVFKKHRFEDPYAFYKPENQNLKNEYLQKIKEMGSATQSSNPNNQKGQSNNFYSNNEGSKDHHSNASSSSLYLILAASGVLACGIYFILPKQQQISRKALTKQDIDRYQQKWKQRIVNRKQNVIQQFQSQQTPSLQFNSNEELPLRDQVFRYTILPDIELFEVHPDVFTNPSEYEFSNSNLKASSLNKMRANTLLTLSLEAERCLHNIYVDREHVLSELKNKGYFQCPGIFFRFHGYIYFKLRPKPLSLVNYRGQKWISLFDLYFRYYSPIYYCQDYFDTYLTSQKEENYFGDIHFNTRSLPLYHLKAGQKNVFMWLPKGGDQKRYQEKYKHIWTNYYSYYVPLATKQN